jgi:ATP-dependent Clp protease ATP-binding subunit ClpA
LVERGYDERMGARPMARVIQEHIKKPLAEILLFGSLEQSAGVVTVSVEDGELVVLAESAEAVEA